MYDEALIRQMVKYYLDGITYADEARLRWAFHPKASSIGHFKGALEWRSVDDFVAGCREAGALSADRAYVSKIASIDITGDVAVAKVIDDYQGTRCTDYLTLLYLDGRWQIVNKTFYDLG